MVSPSLRPDFVAFSMWLMFSYNFELCILSSYFSFYPQKAQSLLNKTNQDVSKPFFVWFHLLLYLNGYLLSYSSGLRNPYFSPRLTCFCLSTSHSLANYPARSTVLESVSFPLQFLPIFEISEALLSSWGAFFECLSTCLLIHHAASLCCHNLCTDLSACEPLADKLLQHFYLIKSHFSCLTFSLFLLFIGLQDNTVCKGHHFSSTCS